MEQKRRHIRFPADATAVALVDTEEHELTQFQAEYSALITDEAPMGGCGILTFRKELEVDQELLVKVGHLSPLRAVVRWVKRLDKDVTRVGLQFLE